MTNPASPGGQQFPVPVLPTGTPGTPGTPPAQEAPGAQEAPETPGTAGTLGTAEGTGVSGTQPDPRASLLPLAATLLLLIAGGLAIGGSFGKLEEEAERAGQETLTLTFTSWRLTQGGSYSNAIYFHAPHFGIPLVASGVLAIVSGLLLVLGRGRLGMLARPAALASSGLLVGTVWTVSLVVSADLDAVTKSDDFELTWTSGIGFWLVLASGIASVLGGIAALFIGIPRTRRRAEPPTPRYGFPASQAELNVPFIPPPAQQVDPLSGHPIGPAVLPVFQPPTPPATEQADPA